MNPLEALSEPQRDAVEHIHGPLLVFAGAGSGKTRVITYRIANMIAREHIPPQTILAITFTNKAAGEMKKRLEALLGASLAREVAVGTFHATCAKLLRIYGDRIGLGKNFIIYDTDDQKQVVNQILRDMNLDEKRFPPRMVMHRIHREKQEGRGPDQMMREDYLDDKIVNVFREYEKRLAAAGAVDFEDLIGKMVFLLEDEHLGQAVRRRYGYVLVDEFQDTNRMQYRLVKALSFEHQNVCVVGDDDQSIYRWRGADVRNIRGFQKDFSNTRVVKLEENYRSTKHIVAAALAVIERSEERVPKELFTSNDPGSPVDLISTESEHEEAAAVVTAIAAARAEGISLSEIAVFYRIHAQSRVLEDALRMGGIPYQIVGGMKFYERAEIKDALSYLRILSNPKSDVDFVRIVNSPPRGIGQTTVERLYRHAQLTERSMFEALFMLDQATEIPAASKKKLVLFRALLEDLRDYSGTHSPSDVLDRMLDRTGYRSGLKTENSVESGARLENLEELVGSIRDFEDEARAAGETPTLEMFLERTALAGADDNTVSDRVSLMTVHAAKGLEFDWVMITGMEEEMFPYRGLQPGGHEELEEERRLAYVAITRAKKRLLMTYASRRQIFGTTRWTKASRFVFDLPEGSVVHRTFGLRSAAAAYARSRPSYPDDEFESMPPPRSIFPRSGSQDTRRGETPMRPAARARAGQEEGRFVDREYFSDDSDASQATQELRKGSSVFHDRFGEGQVRSIANLGEPAVVAFFPGWGEKKVLLRFLKTS